MKKFLSLVLALVMTMSLVTVSAGAKDFTDNDKLTYEEAVNVMSEVKVIDGYTDGSFNPQGSLTRGAAAKIICNLILGPTTAAELSADTAPFADVPTDHTFAGYIAYCAKEGIISGYADGKFRPGNPLTGYAFMKMLLGALGYDSQNEGYVGPNWSINVAKQALNIGLNKGLEGDFNGVKSVNREEACLYAFNTLQSTMVEYKTKTVVSVGGAEVTVAAPAQDVEWGVATKNDGNIDPDNFVQFAEKYFPKLVKNADTDAFMRPAHTWTYAKDEIGTYIDTEKLVASYTTGVSGRTVCDELGATIIRENGLESYVDGHANTIKDTDLVRSNEDDLAATGKGVLTEIYLDKDEDILTFVSVNTYLAQATTGYSDKKETATLKVFETNGNGTSKIVDVADVPAIADVEKDAWLLVTMSDKDTQKLEVVTIADVEVLSDSTVTKFSRGKNTDGTTYVSSLTTGGNKYDKSAKAYYDAKTLNSYNDALLTDCTYNVYLDQYGYFIGAELFEGTKNYVFITGYDRNSSNISVKTATAAAIFLDGKMEPITVNVTDTNKNIAKATNTRYFAQWTSNNSGEYNLNCWYTYTVNEAGVYTLKPADRMFSTKFVDTNGNQTTGTINCSNVRLEDSYNVPANSKAARAFGEDASVFITVEQGLVDTDTNASAIVDVTGIYTGVQDVDLEIADDVVDGYSVHTVYDSNNFIIASIVVGEAKGAAGNYAYVLDTDAKSEEKKGDTYYWEFDAIVGGEIKTLTAKSKYNSLFSDLQNATGNVVELRLDGEYVVDVKDSLTVYGNSDIRNPINGQDVYDVNFQGNNAVLHLQGRTLYTQKNQSDWGLTFVKDAKAVVIQKENNKVKKTEFTSVSEALDRLADKDPTTTALEYKGRITAVLNKNGVAEWVVFNNDSVLTSGNGNNGGNNGNGSVKGVEQKSLSGLTAANDQNDYILTLDDGAYQFDDITFAQIGSGNTGNPTYNFETSDIMVFKFTSDVAGKATLTITDAKGKLYYMDSKTLAAAGSEKFTEIVTDQNNVADKQNESDGNGGYYGYTNSGKGLMKHAPLPTGTYNWKVTAGTIVTEGTFTVR